MLPILVATAPVLVVRRFIVARTIPIVVVVVVVVVRSPLLERREVAANRSSPGFIPAACK
jgi:hypothetical protein